MLDKVAWRTRRSGSALRMASRRVKGRACLQTWLSTLWWTPMSLSQNLAVIYVPVSAIKPRPGNPRKHSQQQLRKLMRIVEEHGSTNPILVDESNVIIAGHLRYEVVLSLGMEEAPVIRLTGLSEAQKRAVMVSDNKIAEESEWVPKVLAQTLQSIIDLDYDPELTGFDTGELNRLLNYAEAEGRTPTTTKDVGTQTEMSRRSPDRAIHGS